MRVLALNASDESGGAARATLRLCNGLRRSGVDLELAVRSRTSGLPWVLRSPGKVARVIAHAEPAIDGLPRKLYRSARAEPWSTNWLPYRRLSRSHAERYDVIHMHWVGAGYVPLAEFSRAQKPLVWTLHDAWAFTGGCHYPGDCTRFTKSCGVCPSLASTTKWDLSRFVWLTKKAHYTPASMRIVSPSRWLAGLAKESSLLRGATVDVIHNGIDLTTFKPIDQNLARSLLGLPKDKRLILFGAANATTDRRKGFDLLFDALTDIKENHAGIGAECVIFGANGSGFDERAVPPMHFVGHVHDDLTLACLYSAADVMVLPSREENLANTAIESLACGTPVVAFDIGGNRDIVSHTSNGYLVEQLNGTALAQALTWVLQRQYPGQLRAAARQSAADRFDLNAASAKYHELYIELSQAANAHA